MLRRLDPRLLPPLCLTLHHSVHPHACGEPPESRVDVLRQFAVPSGRLILESNYIFGIQCAALPASYTAFVESHAGMDCHLAGVYNTEHQSYNRGDEVAVLRR